MGWKYNIEREILPEITNTAAREIQDSGIV